MRIPSSVIKLGGLALSVLAGSLVLSSSPKSPFTRHDKAYYLDAAQVNFVRAGLVFTIKSAKIAGDGTVTVDFTMTDPKTAPLDRDGVMTPGAVSASFVISYIPKGQAQYVSYLTRIENDPNPVVPNAVQATAESNGTFTRVADGEYIYTFANKLPAGFDQTVTHSIGLYGSRNLSDFDLGTQYASTVFTFVPDGSKVAVTRDVVRTASCNKCHDQLAFHGGSRRGLELCILCHTPQTTDSGTGNTLDMKVLAHKIHAGSSLPSVQAGGTYGIVGFQNALSDWSTVRFPANGAASSFAGVIKCQVCHDPSSGAAQATAWNTNPNRAACGSCHDDVNFTTGQNHSNGLPMADDKLCSICHIPNTGGEFDASIMGAHTAPTQSATFPGIVVDILKVENGSAGSKPTVTFTLKDKSGNGIPLDQMKTTPNRVALVMAGPTTDYGYTSFGSDQPANHGWVTEDPTTTGQCSNDGTCTYTFTHAIPANATGTYSMGIEARRGATIMPGTVKQQSTEYGAINKVFNFSVDGSTVTPRRTVVATAKCNNCHSSLSLHGENRNQVEMCVLCHNPSQDDSPTRPQTKDPVQLALPPQSVNFALLIHNIHTGEQMKDQNRTFVVVGFGGSVNDFSDVRYPAMSRTGAVGERRNCSMCHVNGSEQLPLQDGLNQVTQPQGPLTTMGTATAACTACHGDRDALAHASLQTSAQFGESCAVCHGTGADFAVDKVHAQ